MNVLVIDVGGTHIKILASGEAEKRAIDSGPTITAREMASQVRELAKGWTYEAVSVGYPGPVVHNRPISEPFNLGKGWMGFDFETAFGLPTKVMNDAAMQALGAYRGGRLLFLGFGTGLGSALIVDGAVEPMEIAHLPFRKHTYEDYVGLRGLEEFGKKKWRKNVEDVVEALTAAFQPDDVVLGGGNAKKLKDLPPLCRLGDNADAFEGGFRLWAGSLAPAAADQKFSPNAAPQEFVDVRRNQTAH